MLKKSLLSTHPEHIHNKEQCFNRRTVGTVNNDTLGGEIFPNRVQFPPESRVVLELALDLLACVKNGAVIPPAEMLSDLNKRAVGELARYIYGDLAGANNSADSRLGLEGLYGDVEMLRDGPLDHFYIWGFPWGILDDVPEDAVCHLDVDLLAGEG